MPAAQVPEGQMEGCSKEVEARKWGWDERYPRSLGRLETSIMG